ncbi:RHO1 GDP-GTP exchange protein 2, partial [Tulasnella sp. 408]
PTFIEVYNVDSGQLVQIIPGKNLRCLFADVPPSISNSAANANPHVRGNPYMYPDVAGACSQEEERGHAGTGSSMPLSFDGNLTYTRDEIIIVSDDKVMAVRLAPPPALKQQLAAASVPGAEERLGDASVVSATAAL